MRLKEIEASGFIKFHTKTTLDYNTSYPMTTGRETAYAALEVARKTYKFFSFKTTEEAKALVQSMHNGDGWSIEWYNFSD
ncbi:hypothetical protein KAW80_02235 [Candidatus Babeliales bacterium]|nr:hypothetical protein [Candidatus Babeliales bacterium]